MLKLKYILQIVGSTKEQKIVELCELHCRRIPLRDSRDDTSPREGSSRESRSENGRISSVHHRSSTTADTILVHPWLYSTIPRGHLIHRPMEG